MEVGLLWSGLSFKQMEELIGGGVLPLFSQEDASRPKNLYSVPGYSYWNWVFFIFSFPSYHTNEALLLGEVALAS